MTKPITAASIMQLISNNKTAPSARTGEPIQITLDTPAYHFVDGLLAANLNVGGKTMTMAKLFPDRLAQPQNAQWGDAITIRMLLSMTSCVDDYDDERYRQVMYACPDTTVSNLIPFKSNV